MDEVGRITLSYQLNFDTLEEVIYEDNRELEKAYYDAFVTDP